MIIRENKQALKTRPYMINSITINQKSYPSYTYQPTELQQRNHQFCINQKWIKEIHQCVKPSVDTEINIYRYDRINNG